MSLLNECYFRAVSSGTGNFVVSSAITGFYTPAQCTNPAVVDGAIYYYRAESDDLTQYESGYGAYTVSSTTLARTTILQSSNAGAAVNFTAAPRVRVSILAIDPLNTLADSLAHGFDMPVNLGLTSSVAASALTIAIKGADGNDPSAANRVRIPFRSPTAATGVPVWREITAALSLTVSSGSTLGTPTGSVAFRIWVVIFDDGGTLRLGAINCLSFTLNTLATIFPLDEYLVSSTAEGGAGAADSAGVFYTGTAVTTKAYRIVGYLEWGSGLATAGTWASDATIKVLFGPGIKKPGEPVQHKYMESQTETQTTSTTGPPGAVTTATIDIVPRSAANIIKVSSAGLVYDDTAAKGGFVQIFRGGATAIGSVTECFGSASALVSSAYLEGFDRPNTLSSTTYAVYIYKQNAGGIFYYGITSGSRGVNMQAIELMS